MKIIEAFQNDPRSGSVATISSFLIGMVPHVDPEIQSTVIFYFQVMAFSISITVGILTICGMIKKNKRARHERKNIKATDH